METNEILDTSVAIDRKEGVVTIFTFIEHTPSSKKGFEAEIPRYSDYQRAIRLAEQLRAKGTPVGAMDIIIAAMCLNRSATVVTKDKDFDVIKKVVPELKVKKV
ncbi:MAG: PIN domain-containing protein [Nanoarchaeota archaeon]